MPIRAVKVQGRTISQFAAHVGVGTKTVREWIDAGRLDVVEYINGVPFGRSGKEPLLILVMDESRPARLVPMRSNR